MSQSAHLSSEDHRQFLRLVEERLRNILALLEADSQGERPSPAEIPTTDDVVVVLNDDGFPQTRNDHDEIEPWGDASRDGGTPPPSTAAMETASGTANEAFTPPTSLPIISRVESKTPNEFERGKRKTHSTARASPILRRNQQRWDIVDNAGGEKAGDALSATGSGDGNQDGMTCVAGEVTDSIQSENHDDDDDNINDDDEKNDDDDDYIPTSKKKSNVITSRSHLPRKKGRKPKKKLDEKRKPYARRADKTTSATTLPSAASPDVLSPTAASSISITSLSSVVAFHSQSRQKENLRSEKASQSSRLEKSGEGCLPVNVSAAEGWPTPLLSQPSQQEEALLSGFLLVTYDDVYNSRMKSVPVGGLSVEYSDGYDPGSEPTTIECRACEEWLAPSQLLKHHARHGKDVIRLFQLQNRKGKR